MGGNALTIPSKRITTREMEDINKVIVFWMKGLCKVDAIPVKAYRSKETHGDIDIVIPNSVDKELVESLILNHFHSVELVKNGQCWSWSYFGTQIDFVFSECPEFTAQWMNWNDCSNLVGRVAHKFGLKFGHEGMKFPVRDDQCDTHHVKDLLVSRDMKKCLEFMGFDYEKYQQGFDTLEDIFNWVIASPYFNNEIYLLDNRNATSRIRDKKRPTYTAFLKFCENVDKEGFKYSSNKSLYRGMIFREFPELEKEYNEEVALMQLRRERKEKFNGELVKEITGLEGKELGAFIKLFKETHDIDAMSQEEIKTEIKGSTWWNMRKMS